MSDSFDLPHNTVQHTLTLPLWGRKKVTEKFPEFFSDPEAVELSNKLGADHSQEKQSGFAFLMYAYRHMRIVEIVQDFVDTHPYATVVNMGAGLETFYHDIDNGQVTLVNVDLPEVIALRRKFFSPRDREIHMVGDLTTTEWMDSIPYTPEHGIIFVSAGVLFYLQRHAVAQLFDHLGERFPGAQVAFDFEGASLAKKSNKLIQQSGNSGAHIIFTMENADEAYLLSNYITAVEYMPFVCTRYPAIRKTGIIDHLVLRIVSKRKDIGFAIVTFKNEKH